MTSPADTFSDTAGTYWEDAILKLHASGDYLGNQGKALSASTITRQQAVAMIGRAFNDRAGDRRTGLLETDQIAEYALAYVGEFEARGYLTDCTAGTFRPTDAITRAEIINILRQHDAHAGEGEHHCDGDVPAACSSAHRRAAAR